MFTLDEIITCTGGKLLRGSPALRVRGVSTDTRSVRRAQLFLAVKGDNFDGHDFLDKAALAGASAVVISREDALIPQGVAAVLVDDTVKAFGRIARHHRSRFNIPVVGITGSAGKTSTKELIAAVLKKKYRVLFNKGTENNHMGVPATLLKLTRRHQAAVIEMGTNHPGEIAWSASNVCPTIAVFTNVGASHLEGLGSLAGVFEEKVTMLNYLPKDGAVIVNADDPYWARLLKRRLPQKVVSYGIDAAADIKASQIAAGPGGFYFNTAGGKTFMVKSPSWGAVQNALAAIACGTLFGVSSTRMQEALKSSKPAKGRQCLLKAGGVSIIDDTYNANPVSYKNALRTLSMLRTPQGRVILVAADMLELGARSDELHAEVGGSAAAAGIDALFTCGQKARLIGRAAGMKAPRMDVRHFFDKEGLVEALLVYLRKGDVLLLKGSRGMRMEKVAEAVIDLLKGK